VRSLWRRSSDQEGTTSAALLDRGLCDDCCVDGFRPIPLHPGLDLSRLEFNVIFLLLVSVLIFAGRFFVPGHDVSWAGTYEAFAHIWVGVLLATIWWKFKRPEKGWEYSRVAFYALVILTIFETVMFLMR
jgi:hypothetical protein